MDDALVERRIKALSERAGEASVGLACHAALPVALTPHFLHLLRVNFFIDPPDRLSVDEDVEARLLLSSLCSEIGDGLYEVDPLVRPWLLRQLGKRYGDGRIREVATLLWQYSQSPMAWDGTENLRHAQLFSAASFLEPANARAVLEQAETAAPAGSTAADRGWVVAMQSEIDTVHGHVTSNMDIDLAKIDQADALESGDALSSIEIGAMLLGLVPTLLRPLLDIFLDSIVAPVRDFNMSDVQLVRDASSVYESTPEVIREAVRHIGSLLEDRQSSLIAKLALSATTGQALYQLTIVGLPWLRRLPPDDPLHDAVKRLETIVDVVCKGERIGDLKLSYQQLRILHRRYESGSSSDTWASIWDSSFVHSQDALLSRIEVEVPDIRQEVLWADLDALAEQYNELRASMPSGGERTSRMWDIVRNIASVLPTTSSFSPQAWTDDASAGRRLCCVVALRQQSDPALLPWLAERFGVEKPFIIYQTGLALVNAAQELPDKDVVRSAVATARGYLNSGSEQNGHTALIEQAESILADYASQRDFFISYAKNDQAWAEWIARALQDAGYTVVIQAWDYRPEGRFVLDMQSSAAGAVNTIAVLSPDYLESQFTQAEFAAAFAADPTGSKRKLIPVRVEPCELVGLLATFAYVDLVGLNELEAKADLLGAVVASRTDASRPEYPRPSASKIPFDVLPFPGANGNGDSTRPDRTIADSSASVQDRVAAGRRLAEIGDPRPGVGLRADGLPDIVWCDVPGGPFIYQDGEKRTLPTFRISKYPVTYRQFQAFIHAKDGYSNTKWWEDLHADSIKQQLGGPGDQAFKFDNHPRERVSWYDAMAFCRWLSTKLGDTVRLPTEQQWEKAARGTDGRQYPYGNEFDPSKGNTHETGIGQTSAVGAFPHGASPYSLMDMSGNVWEWTLTEYDTGSDTNVGSSGRRVLRGGSWRDDQDFARAASRIDNDPDYRFNLFGFRLASPAKNL